jgi:hypothetical protein
MVSESDSAGFARLVRLAALRVEGTSLRSVAGELGLSPSGLSKLLGGSRSQAGTRRRLERWVVSQRAGTPDAPSPPAEESLRVLAHGLPSALHPPLLAELADAVAESYGRSGVDVPEWVAALRASAGDAPSR